MKTIGVSCVPKFGLLVFLGHPSGDSPLERGGGRQRRCRGGEEVKGKSTKYYSYFSMKLVTWKGIPTILGWRLEGWREIKKRGGDGEKVEKEEEEEARRYKVSNGRTEHIFATLTIGRGSCRCSDSSAYSDLHKIYGQIVWKCSSLYIQTQTQTDTHTRTHTPTKTQAHPHNL